MSRLRVRRSVWGMAVTWFSNVFWGGFFLVFHSLFQSLQRILLLLSSLYKSVLFFWPVFSGIESFVFNSFGCLVS